MTPLELTIESGQLVSVQDLGRRRARAGLATNGALDQYAAQAANALAGNDASEPLIELLLAGTEITVSGDALVAVTGAEAGFRVNDLPSPMWQPVFVPAGGRIAIDAISGGNLSYLAVAGSWEVPKFSGSATSDPGLGFSNLLTAGNRVAVRDAPARLVNPWYGVPLFRVPRLRPASTPVGEDTIIEILPGPDTERVPGIRAALTASPFIVDQRSNYIGVRLTGTLPAARPRGEILSHGVAIGAVELPPSDELIILQRGRSLTAGYPVVAVVSRAAQDRVAQLRPGSSCRMRWRPLENCVAEVRQQRRDLDRSRLAMRALLAGL